MTRLFLLLFLSLSVGAARADTQLTETEAHTAALELFDHMNAISKDLLKWQDGQPTQTDRDTLMKASTAFMFASAEFIDMRARDRLKSRDTSTSDKSALDTYSSCVFASLELSEFVLQHTDASGPIDAGRNAYDGFLFNYRVCRDLLHPDWTPDVQN